MRLKLPSIGRKGRSGSIPCPDPSPVQTGEIMMPGYSHSQTYVVKTTGSECQGDKASREAFFQCGNYCYSGEIKLSIEHAFGGITLRDIPTLVPIVQRQQNNLRYLCDASDIPVSSTFCGTMREIEKACDFVVSDIMHLSSRIAKLKKTHPWIDDDESQVFFELVGDASSLFPDIMFIARRVYVNDLIFCQLYFEGIIYLTLEDGNGDQPLLDINFPELSGSSATRGVTLAIYDDEKSHPWMKLSVWQAQAGRDRDQYTQPVDAVEPTKDLSSDCYIQSYCVLKSEGGSDIRDVMFRFGSWCYDGKVELLPKISLADISHVIPVLRVQQSKLNFVSDMSCLPSSNPFALAMEYASQKHSIMESQAVECEGCLRNLITIVANDESSLNEQNWLEDDECESFFEFTCFNDETSSAVLGDVELIATKSYNPNGVISVSLYYGGNWYLSVSAGSDFPLLDSKFPDLSLKGHGFNIQCYPAGIPEYWPQLRKMSIWRIGHGEDDLTGKHGKKNKETLDYFNEKCGSETVNEQETTVGVGTHENSVVTKAHKWEGKLKEIGDAAIQGDTAWEIDGKPILQKNSEADVVLTPVDNDRAPEEGGDSDGDIYAQLDQLTQTLDHELRGLNGLLK
ncbi:hypothetical protein ACHAXR_007164 [Thalassiosira sp. AJA248-18]